MTLARPASAVPFRRWLVPLLAVLAGCTHRVDFGPTGQITRAEPLLALLAKRDGRFATLSGEVKLKVHSPRGSGTVSQFLAVARPGFLHIESFDFFGKPVSALVSDGQRFSLYDADKNVFYEGPATPQAIAPFLPLTLAPTEAVALILGQVPRIAAQKTALVFDADRQRYRLTLIAGPVRQVLELDPRTLDITRSTVSGAPAFDLALGDYRPAPGGMFPHQITLDSRSADTELTYSYGDVTVNGAPDLSLFHMDPPKTARVIALDGLGQVESTPDGGAR